MISHGWLGGFGRRERNRIPVFALSHGVLSFLRCLLTWAPEDIDAAVDRLARCRRLAERVQPPGAVATAVSSLLRAFSRSEAAPVTPLQTEGLLVAAEASLLTAVLHLMRESAMGFVQCGLSVRSGWSLYKRADATIGGVAAATEAPPDARTSGGLGLGTHSGQSGVFRGDHAPSTTSDPLGLPEALRLVGVTPDELRRLDAAATEIATSSDASPVPSSVLGGILFGMGAFNVVGSVLPPTVMRLIELLGFPCDRCVDDCEWGENRQTVVMSVLSRQG